jgi:hypothetical protein
MINLKISRLPNDPLCLRASIGGDPKMGYYLLFRGDQKKVLEMLKATTLSLEAVCRAGEELEIEEDFPTIGPS